MLDGYLAILAEAVRDREARAEWRRCVLAAPAPPPVGNPTAFRDDWWAWHLANPSIYRLFESYTFEAIASGVTRTGAWLVVGKLRWEEIVVTRGDDFKISNDRTALYARLFMFLHPEHDGLFDVKAMKR